MTITTCAICEHPDRAEIEMHMRNGEGPDWIGERYDLPTLIPLEYEDQCVNGSGIGATRGEAVRRHRMHEAMESR